MKLYGRGDTTVMVAAVINLTKQLLLFFFFYAWLKTECADIAQNNI